MSYTQALFNGIPIFTNPLAVQVTSYWEVQKHPTRKRRKCWKSVRVEVRNPCAYQTPMGIVMHPTLYAKLKREVHEHVFRP